MIEDAYRLLAVCGSARARAAGDHAINVDYLDVVVVIRVRALEREKVRVWVSVTISREADGS